MAESGERILVFKEHWLRQILTREKKLEIRGFALKCKEFLLGSNGKIHGRIRLGKHFQINSDAEWRTLREQDRIFEKDTRPYQKTWAHEILNVEPLDEIIEYTHPRGAVGIVIYKA